MDAIRLRWDITIMMMSLRRSLWNDTLWSTGTDDDAKLHSTNFEGMELIRPMYLIREDDIKHWRDYNGLHLSSVHVSLQILVQHVIQMVLRNPREWRQNS